MDISEKLAILADSAKYDASCSSSGTDRGGNYKVGTARLGGICHTWSADGRCVSLLKVLMTNDCRFDCAYCANRRSNNIPRASFTPQELADLTIEFYRRNYIEGLFLSSGVYKNPDYTMELMIKCLRILRENYGFGGYIHAKIIPGASPALISIMGGLADRISVNIELPSEKSLKIIAPQKSRNNILNPMRTITEKVREAREDLIKYRNAPKFAPAGQSTQMIIGASPENDFQIIKLTQALYKRYSLKRVYYSAYIPINEDSRLPGRDTEPPLLREHRIYQADWLMRFYGFRADEILSDENNMFDNSIDPKCAWALRNISLFPVEVNTAPYEMLLRVPGIGVTGAKRIIKARKVAYIDFDGAKKLGIVMKRAKYFITCKGKYYSGIPLEPGVIYNRLALEAAKDNFRAENGSTVQMSLFDRSGPEVRLVKTGDH